MATQERGGQSSRARARDQQDEQQDTAASAETGERKEQLDSDVDAVLGEIDDVLEENAEDFVRQFVQKGGQ